VVVKHKTNKGKGASMREGFAHILKRPFDSVVVMDGDGQHEVEDIGHFLQKMKDTNADIVIGNRMLNTSSMPPLRIYTNRFMSFLISLMARQHVPDTQSGFRLISSSVLSSMVMESEGFEAETEVLIRAALRGFRIGFVPIATIYSDAGSHMTHWQTTKKFLSVLLKEY
jgi:glycosyltransferase involved in cell wall biosynthesis